MIEVTLGEIDLTFDPETWETVEECAERLEKEGDPFTEDEIEFFFDPETPIYFLRGTDAYIWMLAAPLKDFEGFGTKEYYEGIFDKVNNAVTDDDCTLIDAEIEERNDLLFINSFIDNNNGTFSRYITMSKDKFLYTIGLCFYSDESDEHYLYDLIDSISFDE
ncbi:MAG: hypothetical protein II820_06920 [Ruminiclostridium sp.]|nr:hypothetical protein [Ruminiclostridium sp.]